MQRFQRRVPQKEGALLLKVRNVKAAMTIRIPKHPHTDSDSDATTLDNAVIITLLLFP